MQKNRIEEVEQILSLLKRVGNHLSIARHIALATRGKDIFHLSNKQFLEILEKYELEINFDNEIEVPSFIDEESREIQNIIEDGKNFSHLVDELEEDEENGS